MRLIGPGQAGDSPMLTALQTRNRPAALLADKAYSARAHRAHLRNRGTSAVIPKRADQIGHRINHGSAGADDP